MFDTGVHTCGKWRGKTEVRLVITLLLISYRQSSLYGQPFAPYQEECFFFCFVLKALAGDCNILIMVDASALQCCKELLCPVIPVWLRLIGNLFAFGAQPREISHLFSLDDSAYFLPSSLIKPFIINFSFL